MDSGTSPDHMTERDAQRTMALTAVGGAPHRLVASREHSGLVPRQQSIRPRLAPAPQSTASDGGLYKTECVYGPRRTEIPRAASSGWRPRSHSAPPCTDADLHLVPVGPLGVGVRVRRGRGWVGAGVRRTVARSGRGGRLLARTHGRALPGRRHRRVGRRSDDRRGDRAHRRVPCADVTTGPSAQRTRPTRPGRGR